MGAYVSDASVFRRTPQAVFEPRNLEEVRSALEAAREEGWSVTVRGGGTSVAGNAIGQGLIIDTSRHFNRILEIDPVNRTARVQPGVVCDVLREAAGEYGLTFGPDPSTHSRCTIGGMIGNNACGSHSMQWGTTADNVVELTIMRADGELVTLGHGTVSDPNLEKQLIALRDENLAMLRTELGRFPRQVSGYGLHHLTQEAGFDVAKAFVGSEGTSGIVVEAVVRLVERPAASALAVMAFESVFDAAGAAPLAKRAGASTAEGMGSDLLDALWMSKGDTGADELLPGAHGNPRPAGGWLYCETTGDSPEQAGQRAAALVRKFESESSHRLVDSVVVSDHQEVRQLWKIRESAAGLVTRLPDGREAWPSWEDSAVPPEKLADYLRDLYGLLDKHGLEGVPFGHFGDGCVHIRISFTPGTDAGMATYRTFMEEAAATVARYDGSLSGEHGDGRARSELLPLMYSPDALSAFTRFKQIFDPTGLFNPGILVDPEALDDNLRPGPGQRKKEFIPLHALSRDGGSLVNAVNRCAGVGLCRTESDAMCPSFQITGDEVHSTRGRARVLSEMLRGEVFTEGTDSEQVKDALDLCLSCHACASECPVNVDMATYKSEFLHQHYQKRRRPMAHYSMGWLPLTSHLLHRIPGAAWFADKALRIRPVEQLVKRLGGIDPSRKMINFASSSFQSRARRRRRNTQVEHTRGKVILWPDSFTNHLDPAVPMDALEVLEALGYEVTVPQGFICCGLTWHSTGQLDTAQKVITRTLDQLEDNLDGETPVVCLEPSCAAMLIDTAPELLPDDARAHSLAQQVVSFSEFLTSHKQAGGIWPFEKLQMDALSQTHCHERSRGGHDATSSVLEDVGVNEESIQTGCCGLAGNWGFEPGHAQMSRDLGERELFPRVRAATQGEAILADGFSCRTQIEEGTGVRGKHLAQLLKNALHR
nr:FAD-binding and (Fe-S)-binding domain-containing protein [Enteractinococcus fodinae]